MPSLNSWWAHVHVVPDRSKIKVFKYGMSNGSKVSIPFGGQTPIPRVPVKTSLYSSKNVLGNRPVSYTHLRAHET